VKKYTADFVFPVSSAPIQNGVVITDDSGKILAVEHRDQHDPASLDIRRGILAPGFVNTHCHLELSHMKGRVNTGTGLIPFITGVVTQRNATAEIIADAIEKAEAEMLEGGIVALGDISNAPDTFEVKSRGRMRYYTFVELFDFLQEAGADKAFADWSAVYGQLQPAAGSNGSLSPHAPYSVSKKLFRQIQTFNPERGITVSIHNQETPPENELFERGSGDFYDFYGKFNISLDHFVPSGKGSIHYALDNMNPANRTIFVHNTLSTADDIRAAQTWSPHTFWATCPNANLYIENRLPNYQAFIDTGARVTIGTDSLTSNWQLSILEEMKTIARYQSYVPFDMLLRWATLNGAQALGFDDTLGSLDVGKTPGVLLLEGIGPDGSNLDRATVKRLI
jgi:cytosine/adenosine deaminase-related metal-dependent hydrolase